MRLASTHPYPPMPHYLPPPWSYLHHAEALGGVTGVQGVPVGEGVLGDFPGHQPPSCLPVMHQPLLLPFLAVLPLHKQRHQNACIAKEEGDLEDGKGV